MMSETRQNKVRGTDSSKVTAQTGASAGVPDWSVQKSQIVSLVEKPLKIGATWYLLSVKWFRKWKKYVGFDPWNQQEVGVDFAYPGPIDNSDLFADQKGVVLKNGLSEDIDYSLVPEGAWRKLVTWYGVGVSSQPIARQVVEYGLFNKHKKVEIYYLKLNLVLSSDLNNVAMREFSRAEKLGNVMKAMKEVFTIPAKKECRLWRSVACSDTYDLLTDLDKYVFDVELLDGQILLMEQRNDDGTWPQEVKSVKSSGSSVISNGSSRINWDKPGDTLTISKWHIDGKSLMGTSKLSHKKPAKSKQQITTGGQKNKKVCHQEDVQVVDVQVVAPRLTSQRKAETRVDKVRAGPANDSRDQIMSSSNSSFLFQTTLESWNDESPILRNRNYQDENASTPQAKKETKNTLYVAEELVKFKNDTKQEIAALSTRLQSTEAKSAQEITTLGKRVHQNDTDLTALSKRLRNSEDESAQNLAALTQQLQQRKAETDQEIAKLGDVIQRVDQEKVRALTDRVKQNEEETSQVSTALSQKLKQKEDEIDLMNQELTETRGQLKQLENELAVGNYEVATLRERLQQSERDSREACALSERLQDEIGIVNLEMTALTERLQQREADTHQEMELFTERLQGQETRLQEFCNNALQQMRRQLDTTVRQQTEQLTQRITVLQNLFNAVKPEWLIQRREIHLGEITLGNGGWGRVVQATFRGEQVAAKCLHNQIISDYNIQRFVREMQISSQCHHPNLLKFLGATLEGDPIILTELMQTNLHDVIRQHELKDHQLIPLLQDIASGINYLHCLSPKPIIHRDISSSNVLLRGPDGSKWIVKLSDFGSANFLWHTNEQSRAPGNPTYAAPEVLNPHEHSEKMDVYSFGVLMFEVCSGQAPSLQDRNEVLPAAPAVWGDPQRHFVPLIVSCTMDSKDDRPTMNEVLTRLGRL